MTAACRCPAMPEVSSPIAGAMRCDCCGELLELTCPKACGKAEPVTSPGHQNSGKKGPGSARTYAEKACALCHRPFTPTGSRSLVCDRCNGEKSATQPLETPVGIASGSGEKERA